MLVNDCEQPRRGLRVLAVASGGGHWVQLLRLAPAFAECDVAYVCVRSEYAAQVQGNRYYKVADATRWSRVALVRMAIKIAWILAYERPDVVLSTGAAPGFVALRLGGLLGARTIWIDSVANAEKLSLSGERIGRHADLWLTQWPHLAGPAGPKYIGSVL